MKFDGFKRFVSFVLCVVFFIMCCPLQVTVAKAAPEEDNAVRCTVEVYYEGSANAPAVGVTVSVKELAQATSQTNQTGETAPLLLPKPEAGEAPVTYTLLVSGGSIQQKECELQVAYDAEAEMRKRVAVRSSATADLTVAVADADGNAIGGLSVTLHGEEGSKTVKTTSSGAENMGSVVFEGLYLANTYSVAVEKTAASNYYTTKSYNVVLSADGNSFAPLNLRVVKATTDTTERKIDITSENVSHISDPSSDGYLLYDLGKAGFFNTKIPGTSFRVVLGDVENDANNKPVAWVSDENGVADARGQYITIAATTTSSLKFTVTEEDSEGEPQKITTYSLEIEKAALRLSYYFGEMLQKWESGHNFRYGEAFDLTFKSFLGDTERSFETATEIAVNTPKTLSYNNGKLSTVRAKQDGDGTRVTVSRAEDTWYEEIFLTFEVSVERADRPAEENQSNAGFAGDKEIDYGEMTAENTLTVLGEEETGVTRDISYAIEMGDGNAVYGIASNSEVPGGQLAEVNENGEVTLTEGVYGSVTVKATIAATTRYNEVSYTYRLTVKKTQIDEDEKPFTLKAENKLGEEVTPSYSYILADSLEDSCFVLEDSQQWYKQVTLYAAEGYTVKIGETELDGDGYVIPEGETKISFTYRAPNDFKASSSITVMRDNTAPEVSYTIETEAVKSLFNVLGFGLIRVYADAEISVSVTAEDGKNSSGIDEVSYQLGEAGWTTIEKDENGEWKFTVETTAPLKLSVRAIDLAGNSNTAERFNNKLTQEEESVNPTVPFGVMLDSTAPEITVGYSAHPVNTIDGMPIYNSDTTPTISVSIAETNYSLKADMRVTLYKDGDTEENLFSIDEYGTGRYTPAKDGNYVLTVSYTDVAGHAAGFDFDRGSAEDGTYTYEFCYDTTAPEITVGYSADPVNTIDGMPIYNSDTTPTISVSIAETNYSLKADMSVTLYRDGDTSRNLFSIDASGNGSYTPAKDGNYVLTVSYTDVAGHAAGFDFDRGSAEDGTYTYSFSIDTTAPEVSYTIETEAVNSVLNVLGLGLIRVYAVDEISVSVAADDGVLGSGVKEVSYQIGEGEWTDFKSGEWKFTVAGETTAPLKLSVRAIDFAGNAGITNKASNELTQEEKQLLNGIDPTDPSLHHDVVLDVTTPEITVRYSAQPVKTIDGMPIYNSDTTPTISVSIAETNYSLKADMRVTLYKDGDTANNLFPVNGSGNGSYTPTKDGNYVLTVSYTDVAGHLADISSDRAKTNAPGSYTYEFCYDTTAPVVTVGYSTNPLGIFGSTALYRDGSHPTISISTAERYYSLKADMSVTLYRDGDTSRNLFSIDASGNGSYTPTAEGDYILTIAYTDAAGHAAGFDSDRGSAEAGTYTYSFSIDNTAPAVTIGYSTNPAGVNAIGGNGEIPIYRDGAHPNITVSTVERYYSLKADMTVTLYRDGDTANNLFPVNGSGNGSYTPTQEGAYLLTVAYTDAAGHPASISSDRAATNMPGAYTYAFIIDNTAVEVSFTDATGAVLRDKTAYSDTLITANVHFLDDNLAAEDISVTLSGWIAQETENGLSLENVEFSSMISGVNTLEEGKSYEITTQNLQIDAVYTLAVRGTDLAGHTFTESRMFSVNRDGSTFYIDGETAELVEKYYSNKSQDVVIHEVSAEPLKSTDISIAHNLDVTEYLWEREAEAAASERRFEVAQNDANSWSEYVYEVKSSNFETQGDYSVSTNSVAAITSLKRASSEIVAVKFLIDTTLPTIHISGVEEDGRYRTDVQTVTVTCEDDQRLDSIAVYLNGELLAEYSADDLTVSQEVLSVEIAGISEYRRQNLRIVAQDKAGNEPVETGVSFYVSANIWYLYRNYFLIGGAALLAICAVVAAALIVRKKKRNAGI